MPNKALAKAIIDSGKKKKTVARLARMEPWELSKVLHGDKFPTEKQRERLVELLGKPEADLFPDLDSSTLTSGSEAGKSA